MLIFAAFALIMILILLTRKQKFIFYVPLLLQLTDISKILIVGGPASPVAILLDYSLILISLSVCLLIILQNSSYIRKHTNGVFILLIYFLVMIMFSTDIWWSFKRYLNVALELLILPAAFIIVKRLDDIRKITTPAILLILAFLLNIAISTYFKLSFEGEGFGYGASSVYLGSVNFYSGFGFVYALILIPLAYYLTNKTFQRYFLIILYFAGLYALILILKRTYIYLALAGPLLFIFFTTKRRNLRFAGPFFIIGFIGYILLSEYILASFTIREEVIRRGYAEEGRGIELILYPEVVKYSPNQANFILFGEELFNSQGKFTLIEKVLNDQDRLLHSDVATILYGAGALGLFLFIRMNYFIINKYLRFRKRLKAISHNEMLHKLYATFVSIFFCLIVNSLSDGMTSATNRVLPYMILGAILGLFYNRLYNPINNTQIP